jgi:hypothetical protein
MAGTYLDYIGTGVVVPGGHFRVGVATGSTTGLTANQAICSLRWTDAAHQYILLKLKVYANINTAYSTAQLSDIALWFNRAFTVAPSGGTSVVPFGVTATGKVRDQGGSMQNSLISTWQVATTGNLTVGTRVQDSRPIAYGQFNIIALGSTWETTLYDAAYANEHPVVLGVNEGLEVTIPTAQGSTGVVVYYLNWTWAEVNNF